MFCSHCGTNLPDGALFCDHCGGDPTGGTPGPAGAPGKSAEANSGRLLQGRWLVALVGGVVVIIVAFAAFFALGGGNDGEQPAFGGSRPTSLSAPGEPSQTSTESTPRPTAAVVASDTVAPSESATVDASASEQAGSPAAEPSVTTSPAARETTTTTTGTTAPTTPPATVAPTTAPATTAPTTVPPTTAPTTAPPTTAPTSAPPTTAPTTPTASVSASVSGQIYYDNSPCGFCSVWIYEQDTLVDYLAESDADGLYSFPSISQGVYSVWFYCDTVADFVWYMDDVPFDPGANGYFIDMPKCL